MIEKVKNTIGENALFAKGDKVLIGFSGGADSRALLDILNEIKDDYALELFAVHINHGIRREEAQRDEEFCRDICEKLNISFKAYSVDCIKYCEKNKISLEEGARILRYEKFKLALEEFGCAKIAVAHNLNDRAETMLMRLMRGTSSYGLRGMEIKRGDIVRPLFDCTREEIENHLKRRNISFVTDSTNESLDYTRNRIRNVLLPLMEKEFNPNILTALAKTGESLKEDNDYINEHVKKYFSQYVELSKSDAVISAEAFEKLQKGIINRLIRMCVRRIAGDDVDFEHSHTNLVYKLHSMESGKEISLTKGLKAANVFGDVAIFTKKEPFKEFFPETDRLFFIDDETGYISASNTPIYFKENFINTCTCELYYDKIMGSPNIRSRKDGDLITAPSGKIMKLKDFFIERRIPVYKRDSIALLACGKMVCAVFSGINYFPKASDGKDKIYIGFWRSN